MAFQPPAPPVFPAGPFQRDDGGTVDKTVDTLFERPDELPVGGDTDSVDLPLGSLRDPLNFDPGPPGPAGGRDDPAVPRPPGGVAGLKVLALAALAVLAIGQVGRLFDVQVG